MTSVVQGQTTLQSMTYGPDGKRLSLTDSSGTRKFFYDGNDVIQEYDSNWSTVNREYTHGPWVDEPLSMTDKSAKQAGDTYYLMKDRLGSIIHILDENETLKTTYSYDAFGEPTATHHSGQVDCPYRFTARVYDGAMGAYFYRARYYNQSLGRFFSLYAYCNNFPANFTDPSGMWSDFSAEHRDPVPDPDMRPLGSSKSTVSNLAAFMHCFLEALHTICANHTEFGKRCACCVRYCSACAWEHLSAEDAAWVQDLWCATTCIAWAWSGDDPEPPDLGTSPPVSGSNPIRADRSPGTPGSQHQLGIPGM